MEQHNDKSENKPAQEHSDNQNISTSNELPSSTGLITTSPNNEGVNKTPGYITANPITYKWTKEFRAQLKQNPTYAEKVLWEYLQHKRIGYKIRRQHVVGDFIADFICIPKKTIIEIDGKIHDKHKIDDAIRTTVLNNLGFDVIRFKNEDVLSNPDKIAERIKAFLSNKPDKA